LRKKDVLSLPLEAIFTKDSISYVYAKTGFSVLKKQVLLGDSNNDKIIITNGLKENEVVYLNKPEGYDDKEIKRIK
jgi:hypothetical protein